MGRIGVMLTQGERIIGPSAAGERTIGLNTIGDWTIHVLERAADASTRGVKRTGELIMGAPLFEREL